MKTKRQIISIDEDLCNGCGACIDGCHEGALQLIDGKARMVSELYCDGLGACIGECPVGAISIEEREAEAYDEDAVMERIAPKGEATILAHLRHLQDHGETGYLRRGLEYLQRNGIRIDTGSLMTGRGEESPSPSPSPSPCGCPGSMERRFTAPAMQGFGVRGFGMGAASVGRPAVSQLAQWPVQLHLLNPSAGYFQGADVVLAADCTAYAFADFHDRFLRGRALAIACPKLDSNREAYISKITDMIDSARINTLTVVIMEVPCCGGLLQIARQAVADAVRKVPVKTVVIGVQGEIKHES